MIEVTTALDSRYRIGNYIDTFALGHYARVLDAEDVPNNRVVAFKVMRPEHLSDDGTPRWEARGPGRRFRSTAPSKRRANGRGSSPRVRGT